jgi:hypothetical protein
MVDGSGYPSLHVLQREKRGIAVTGVLHDKGGNSRCVMMPLLAVLNVDRTIRHHVPIRDSVSRSELLSRRSEETESILKNGQGGFINPRRWMRPTGAFSR